MENNMNKKKINIITIFLIILILFIGIYFVFIKSNQKSDLNKDDNRNINKEIDELSIGEQKYLEFLWMVDGAFNYERYNKEEFFVNDKKLERKPSFLCNYDKDMKTCEGVNFEDNFHKLFASNVKLDIVYGDGVSIRWYEKLEDKYLFTNTNGCDAGRMNTKQKITVENTANNKITYKVIYDEELKSGIYKGQHHFDKKFVLVYENDDWKVSEAYYHNPCYMDYDIK